MIQLCAAAAAGPTAIVNGVGVGHLIGRHGSFLPQSPDDLVGLRVHRGGQERALAILRSSPAQLVVLALQGGDLIIGQEVEHRAGVAVLVLDDQSQSDALMNGELDDMEKQVIIDELYPKYLKVLEDME